MEQTTKPSGLELLRVPFEDRLIGKLPKETKQQAEERKASHNAISCRVCHGYHHKNAVHLDYVGHAAVTDRLLQVDPAWYWEPLAFGADGLPKFDDIGGLWIRLTIMGVTRIGYGNADKKPWTDIGSREKEVIGDALRNAAMRFGVALDLWSKEELRPPEPEPKGDGSGEDPPFDGHPTDVPSRQDAAPTPTPDNSQADYPKAQFEKSFPQWKDAIEAGQKTAAQVIAMASSKGRLNPLQRAKIEAVRRK